MPGLSDTEWAAIVVGVATIVAALVASPRTLRFDIIQRRSVLNSLRRISPTVRDYYDSLPSPSAWGRVLFLSGFFATAVVGLAVDILTPASQIAGAIWIYFFVSYLAASSFAQRYTNKVRKSPWRQLEPPKDLGPRDYLAPAVVFRALLVMGIGDTIMYLVIAQRFQEILSSGGLGLVVIGMVAAPVYFLQTADLFVIATSAIYRDYLAKSGLRVPVELHLDPAVSRDASCVSGDLLSIGPTGLIRRSDGNVEDVSWGTITRVAAKAEPFQPASPKVPPSESGGSFDTPSRTVPPGG